MFCNTSFCAKVLQRAAKADVKIGIEQRVELWQAYLIFLFMGVFVALLALFFNYIRTTVFHDKVGDVCSRLFLNCVSCT